MDTYQTSECRTVVNEKSDGKFNKKSIGALVISFILFTAAIILYKNSNSDSVSRETLISSYNPPNNDQFVTNNDQVERTDENHEKFVKKRREMYGVRDLSQCSLISDIEDDALESSKLKSDVSAVWYSDVEYRPTSGDYVIIRSVYGGLLYSNSFESFGNENVKAYGEYFGDENVFLVGYNSNIGGYTFQNQYSGEYLDTFYGDLTTLAYVDSYTVFTVSSGRCSDDASASLYRKVYSQLTNINTGDCIDIWDTSVTDSCDIDYVDVTSDACNCCSSLFTFEVLA